MKIEKQEAKNQEIRRLERSIGDDLQGLEKLAKECNVEKTKVNLPTGVFKKAYRIRDELYFINNYILRSNLAYHLMVADFYNWLLERFDIGLTIKEMLIKETICLYGNIIEAVAKHSVANLRSIRKSIPEIPALFLMIKRIIPKKELRQKIIEAINRALYGYPGIRGSLSILVKHKIISKTLKTKILKIWNWRNREHIFTLKDREYGMYNDELYINLLSVWEEFKSALTNAKDKGKI